MGKQWKQWETLFGGAPKSLQMVTAAMELKDTCSLAEKLRPTIQHIKKQRHYFANKDPPSQGYGFSSGRVWMWELDYKKSWALKNWCFWCFSGSWWWTRKPGVLQAMGPQRVGHDWATELNWILVELPRWQQCTVALKPRDLLKAAASVNHSFYTCLYTSQNLLCSAHITTWSYVLPTQYIKWLSILFLF